MFSCIEDHDMANNEDYAAFATPPSSPIIEKEDKFENIKLQNKFQEACSNWSEKKWWSHATNDAQTKRVDAATTNIYRILQKQESQS